MRRTLIFDSLWEDEWEFDSNESPIAPGAKELVDEIVRKLKAVAFELCQRRLLSPKLTASKFV